ncbi:MAG: hypothetical protein ACRDYA_02490 [Egibacteraceae bacterium]
MSRRRGLAALDLVPRDLPAAQALDLPRRPAAADRGACHAVLADDGVLRAAGITPDQGNRTAPELAAATVQLELHAPASTDLVVAPRLTAAPDVAARAHDRVCAHLASGLGGHTVRQWAVRPGWAAAVLAAWSAQPLLVFAGSRGLKPGDLWSYRAARPVEEPARLRTTDL